MKESRRERTEDEEEEFHRTALVTQHAARELANKFNEEVEELGLRGLPKVAYMTCCVLTAFKMESQHGQKPDPHEPETRCLFA